MNKKDKRLQYVLLILRTYGFFFLLMSFIVSCCMVLFLKIMQESAGMVLSEADISRAAKITFLNVILLSLLCTIADVLRRKIAIERPVRQIVSVAEKLMQGDFSARIPPIRGMDPMGGLDTVAGYINKAAEELSGMETLRTDFIANVSHELKTPLAVMQNYGMLLKQPGLPEEKRLEYAEAVEDAAKRLASLITNILKLNKLENQQIYPSKQRYNLGEQLCECLLSFENTWEKKNIEIETELEEDVYVEEDKELLSLVWNNLFSNAVKFTESGGRICLRLTSEKHMAVVQVSDTGCGISREVGPHIFEKFYQGDASRSVQGNGLGLALVKRVMEVVKGDISVESEVGRGSIFTVKIGRKTDEAG